MPLHGSRRMNLTEQMIDLWETAPRPEHPVRDVLHDVATFTAWFLLGERLARRLGLR